MKQYDFRVNGQPYSIKATKLHTALGRLGETLENRGYDKPENLRNNLTISMAGCRTVQPSCQHVNHAHNIIQLGNLSGTVRYGSVHQGTRRYQSGEWIITTQKCRLCATCRSFEEQQRQKYQEQIDGQKKLNDKPNISPRKGIVKKIEVQNGNK